MMMGEKAPLAPDRGASYGTTSETAATRVPVLKKRSRRIESEEILRNIDEYRKGGAKLFVLLQYLRDLDAGPDVNPWWTILDEKRFFTERFEHTAAVVDSDKHIDRDLVCHALQVRFASSSS
jgi:hypothetical protein